MAPSAKLTVQDVAELRADRLAEVMAAAAAELLQAKQRVELINQALELRYRGRVQDALKAAKKDFGKVRFPDGEFEVEAELEKKVDWDQALLWKRWQELEAEGEQPREYIKAELSVGERVWNAWTDKLRARFKRARDVRPGRLTIALKRREERPDPAAVVPLQRAA